MPLSCPVLRPPCPHAPISPRRPGDGGKLGLLPSSLPQEEVFLTTSWGTCQSPSFVSCLRAHCQGWRLNALLFIYFVFFFSPLPALRQERVSDLCYSSMATIRLHSEFPYITNGIKHSPLRFCWIWTRLSGENGLRAELASVASAVSLPCNASTARNRTRCVNTSAAPA